MKVRPDRPGSSRVGALYVGDYERNVGAGDGAVMVTKYCYALGRLIALRRAGVLYWVGSDHLGGTIRTLDASFNALDSMRYRPYGSDRDAEGKPEDRPEVQHEGGGSASSKPSSAAAAESVSGGSVPPTLVTSLILSITGAMQRQAIGPRGGFLVGELTRLPSMAHGATSNAGQIMEEAAMAVWPHLLGSRRQPGDAFLRRSRDCYLGGRWVGQSGSASGWSEVWPPAPWRRI